MEKLKEIAASLAVDHLLPLLRKAANSVMEVPKDVADMKDKLDGIQAMIHDADKMAAAAEEGNSRDEIKAKVKQLVQTSFRLEDIIDEHMIHEEKQLADDPGCAALPCKAIDFIKTTATRLQFAYMNEEVKSEFHGIKERNTTEDCSLMQSFRGSQNTTFDKLRMDPLYLKEAEVVGFNEPRDMLEKWLKEGRKERSVISVVGMGGAGKTTLAKKVFDRVQTHFSCHAWITVSQSYTVEGLLRDMLLKFREGDPSTMDRISLIDKVRKHMSHKRYVVVFDDVWNENFWDEMGYALIDNENESRVLITTRNKDVVKSCKRSGVVTQEHDMQRLTHDNSFKLFCKKAFGSDFDGHCPSNLKGISNEIVKKCNGLPLAIVAIGGFLFDKDRETLKWQSFNQNLSKMLEKDRDLSPVTKILSFSYHDLPNNLKPCFLYFGVFPEDYELNTVRLIRQWVAEGFVKHEELETSEEVAQKHLNELIRRSLVQVSSITTGGRAKTCRVHDLVRDMILKKIEDLSFSHFTSEHGNCSESGMIRRLTMASSSMNETEAVKISNNIRSLHMFGDEGFSEPFVESIPLKYKLLKVLDLESWRLGVYILKNLGDLVLLRYLSLRNTEVTNLPRSIGMLHNLETLDLSRTRLCNIPGEINKLKKLRHLLGESIRMENGIGDGEFASLQTLREVDLNHHGGGEVLLKGLERLTQLRVLGFNNVVQDSGFKNGLWSLINKMQHLEKLYITSLIWLEVIDLSLNVSEDVLQRSSLRKVRIAGHLKEFPMWVAKLQNLVELSLSDTYLIDDPLPLLKDLPNLTCLSIHTAAYRGEGLHFSKGGFQNLKQILLRRLPKLKSIVIEDGALPSLERFMLDFIPELTEVPRGIDKLPKLKIFHVNQMQSNDNFIKSFHSNRGQRPWVIEDRPTLKL